MKRWFLIFLTAICLLTGCNGPKTVTKELFAMDTVMHLTVYEGQEAVLEEAQQEILRLEQLLSVTRPDSEIARLNQSAGEWVDLSETTVELIALAKGYAAQTDGLFDPTVYPAVQAWGFTASQKQVPTPKRLAELTALIDYRQVEIHGNRVRLPAGMGLDGGGIAKGYAADRIREIYEQRGCSGVFSLGGNVMTVGQKPDGALFTVAIQDPADAAKTLATLSVPGNCGVATSGDYQRYFEQDGVRYHHILDPKTAAPAASDLVSVTVIASSAAAADAYATALFVAGQEKAQQLAKKLSLQAVLVTRSRQVLVIGGVSMTSPSPEYTFQMVESV